MLLLLSARLCAAGQVINDITRIRGTLHSTINMTESCQARGTLPGMFIIRCAFVL